MNNSMTVFDFTKPDMKPSKGQNAEYAYRVLKSEIVMLKLAPGSDFDEADHAKRLNISRTPLREAVIRLSEEGLLKLSPNRGTRVTPMEWDDIREHLEAFEMSQRLTHRWCAVRRSEADMAAIEERCLAFEKAMDAGDANAMSQINWDFHSTIARGTKNARIQKFYIAQLTENFRISRMAMLMDYYPDAAAYNAHTARIRSEHREIVQAIRDQDADAADDWAQKHSELARKRVAEVLLSSIGSSGNLNLTTKPGEAGA